MHIYLLHVGKQVAEASEGLLTTGADLLRGQDEAVTAGVAELRGESVVALDDVGDVVDTAAGGLVDGAADGAVVEAQAVNVADGVDSALGKGLVLVVLVRESLARVSIG